jgi:hypothetical protein
MKRNDPRNKRDTVKLVPVCKNIISYAHMKHSFWQFLNKNSAIYDVQFFVTFDTHNGYGKV